jgi:hypothetical protein
VPIRHVDVPVRVDLDVDGRGDVRQLDRLARRLDAEDALSVEVGDDPRAVRVERSKAKIELAEGTVLATVGVAPAVSAPG